MPSPVAIPDPLDRLVAIGDEATALAFLLAARAVARVLDPGNAALAEHLRDCDNLLSVAGALADTGMLDD